MVDELLTEMEHHVRLMTEYQAWAARRLPTSPLHVELRMLVVDTLTWIKTTRGKPGETDWVEFGRIRSEEYRLFDAVRKAVSPMADLYMNVWYDWYQERLTGGAA